MTIDASGSADLSPRTDSIRRAISLFVNCFGIFGVTLIHALVLTIEPSLGAEGPSTNSRNGSVAELQKAKMSNSTFAAILL